jgi:hypothetical protein
VRDGVGPTRSPGSRPSRTEVRSYDGGHREHPTQRQRRQPMHVWRPPRHHHRSNARRSRCSLRDRAGHGTRGLLQQQTSATRKIRSRSETTNRDVRSRWVAFEAQRGAKTSRSPLATTESRDYDSRVTNSSLGTACEIASRLPRFPRGTRCNRRPRCVRRREWAAPESGAGPRLKALPPRCGSHPVLSWQLSFSRTKSSPVFLSLGVIQRLST